MDQESLAQHLEGLSADEVIDRVLADNSGRVCITCSFQAEGMIVLSLLRQRIPDVPVLFLDTGYHFAETYAYRDRMAREWSLNLKNLGARQSVAAQEAQFGVLNQTDPSRCCHMRKVEPLFEALEEYDIWFTGLRRDQSPTRKNLRITENHVLPSGKRLLKVNPLAAWTSSQVWQWTGAEKIPHHPLYDEGYPSIGCQPCTTIPLAGAHSRSGRWAGAKLECGIHTFSRQAEEQQQHQEHAYC
jgi:phosphoadenosine phosphosulfate reductase